jgi:hypothetical protein
MVPPSVHGIVGAHNDGVTTTARHINNVDDVDDAAVTSVEDGNETWSRRP